jgi:hypothetical protein
MMLIQVVALQGQLLNTLTKWENNMYDFGEQHRKQFLEEEKVNRRQERQAYWLLLITSTYVIIHMSLYLYRTYL